MNVPFNRLLTIALGYFIGAIPFGLLIAKIFYGTDIRAHGSGNPGATNVWRVLGWKPGASTLALDAVKGALPVIVARKFLPGDNTAAVLAGLAAIVGHNWTIFLRGKGGKGVATSAGVFLALLPKQAGIAILAFLVVFLISRRVSVGSMTAAVALAGSCFVIATPLVLKALVIVAAVMVFFKHIPNLRRLAQGTEPKVNFR